jgi:hypothetical protein
MTQTQRIITNLSVAALAALIAVAPAEAQKKDKGKDRDQARSADVRNQRGIERPELIRRGDNVRVTPRAQDRGRGNAPAFCRSGEGHPVHGRQWCRDKGFGLGSNLPIYDRRVDDRRIDDRRYRTFEEAHEAFHREHDRQCRLRAAERPLDPAWQLRVRTECRAEHDRWHERNDPNWRRS